MKILLDECVPRKFKRTISGHECQTAPEAGSAGKSNGELLKLAEQNGFDIFVTLDKGVEYEQNIASRRIAVIILLCKSNQLEDLLLLVPGCTEALSSILPGELVKLG